MEPITTAILAVLPTLAADTVKSAVKDSYEALKEVIRRKWGDTSPINKAISALEEDPTSKAQAAVLEEKIVAANAAEDADVIQALRQLVEQMKAHGVGGEAVARIQFTMSGGVMQGVAGAENVHIGSMTFGAPPPGQQTMEKIRILFVSANPVGTPPLKLDKEVREIEAKNPCRRISRLLGTHHQVGGPSR